MEKSLPVPLVINDIFSFTFPCQCDFSTMLSYMFSGLGVLFDHTEGEGFGLLHGLSAPAM